MTAKTTSPQTHEEQHDPFAIRSIEQLMTLPDGGDFLQQFLTDHIELMKALHEHMSEYGSKAKGSFQIKFSYELGTGSDLGIEAKASFTPPKKPSSKGAAFVGTQGDLTLYSPMMKRMQSGIRDVTPHDPETGEVRDV